MAPPTKFTSARRDAALTQLRANANVSEAARRARVHRVTLYDWRRAHPEFAEAWDDAVEEAIDAAEAEALRRGVEGTARPVFHQGKRCGEIRHYSDDLLKFVLRARRPWRYGHAAEMARREARNDPPVVVELVHFGDKESFEERKAGLEADRAAGKPGVPPGIAALSDRLATGTSLSTEAPGGPP